MLLLTVQFLTVLSFLLCLLSFVHTLFANVSIQNPYAFEMAPFSRDILQNTYSSVLTFGNKSANRSDRLDFAEIVVINLESI